jgi:hypothetical protein
MIAETLTANGTTIVGTASGFTRGTLWVSGTFGGGTAVLEASRDNGTTWLALDQGGTTATTFTANGMGNFQISGTYKMRVRLSGATSPNIFVAVDIW